MRWWSCVCGWGLCGALLLVPVSAQAQRGPDAVTTQRVLTLLRQAEAAFEVSDFETALRAYQQAYQLRQDPTILHNVARALVRLGRDDEAAETWRLFLERSTDVPDRPAIEQLIREARARAEQRRAPAVVVTPAPPPAPPPVATRRVEHVTWPVGGFVLTGVGGASVVSGAILAGLYAAGMGSLQNSQNCVRASDGLFDCEPSARELGVQSVAYGNAAWGLLAGGAALTGSGLAWLLLGRTTRSVEVRVDVALQGAGLRVGRRW